MRSLLPLGNWRLALLDPSRLKHSSLSTRLATIVLGRQNIGIRRDWVSKEYYG